MEYTLRYLDELVLDRVYEPLGLERDNVVRQLLSVWAFVSLSATVAYLIPNYLWYRFVFDRKRAEAHPRYLKNQVSLEIQLSLQAIPPHAFLASIPFVGEVRGYSKMYHNIADHPGGLPYYFLSIVLFILFSDFMIYWIHRLLHHPLIYSSFHKPHHRWIVPTPFASHAFHAIDGFAQSLPYHLFPYLVPMHISTHMALFILINLWTISIHDQEYLSNNELVNGAAHHAVHHLFFNYNYGQYFTLFDRMFGTFRHPSEAIYQHEIITKGVGNPDELKEE